MQTIIIIVAFSLILVGAMIPLAICHYFEKFYEYYVSYVSYEKQKKINRIINRIVNIFLWLIVPGLALLFFALAFMTQSQYNKAVIGTTITGKPSTVVIDNNTKVRLNVTTNTLSLAPITDTIEIQQANGNTNFKANVLVKYKMVKDEDSILNFYKEYGTNNVKKIVNNEIKSEIAKQSNFAKTGQISEQTFKNIQNGLNNTFEFQSMTVSDFVSSNTQNINLTKNK